jgi:hypothetical protein
LKYVLDGVAEPADQDYSALIASGIVILRD